MHAGLRDDRPEEQGETVLAGPSQPQRRVYGSNAATKPSFMSLYVQLSRAERWEGLYIFRKPARADFIEPKNILDRDMRNAVLRLERIGEGDPAALRTRP
jgi:hypothetical protein